MSPAWRSPAPRKPRRAASHLQCPDQPSTEATEVAWRSPNLSLHPASVATLCPWRRHAKKDCDPEQKQPSACPGRVLHSSVSVRQDRSCTRSRPASSSTQPRRVRSGLPCHHPRTQTLEKASRMGSTPVYSRE